MNETHDPRRTSWVTSAAASSNFPIQNLPFGVFRRAASQEAPRVGIAIGDQILDVGAALHGGYFTGLAADAAAACAGATLNPFLALGRSHWSELRHQTSALLAADSVPYRTDPARAMQLLVPMAHAEMLLPTTIGDYTDFYASIHHATNVGSMFRPDNPLLPNYKYVPIGYHGRASSIVVSGTPIRRPWGQLKDADAAAPAFAPCRSLDYEAELGCYVGPGNALGEPIPIGAAEDHIFGCCLVNDWSARDIQSWEYQPLGPFLAKSFATTVSPWIVTLEALEPFRAPQPNRPAGDPPPLPYLDSPAGRRRGGMDITVEVYLSSAEMRAQNLPPMRLSTSRTIDLYWTVAQLLTHHASNGCNLRPGDLFASGTISGPTKDARGCLLELAWRGTDPLTLPTGESRRFLQDGDEVTLQAYCEREGATRIGFGDCRGIIAPAVRPQS